ncbi:tRNA dimethylallyltransferase [Cichlidogyrus casuarinus]|uniref:tRNA dimethylallyltransferase n=1 Tax=Cichlidogyrus casuarinus TaxID=1844966 RepID=A0ABD2Q6C3_9PLAT
MDSKNMNKISKLSSALVVILGRTGTGKSQLAIDLARKLDGEVINADAVQLYKGLDIVTNKVTQEDFKGVVHHMLGELSFTEGKDFNVHRFRNDAWKCIEEIRSRNRVPIIVGGTLYYIEALLYSDFLNKPKPVKDSSDVSDPNSDDLHAKLKRQKPELAAKLHPNALRKIRSALSNFKDVNKDSRPIDLAFPNSLILWLEPSDELIFSAFLNQRVDNMLDKGLVDELDSYLREVAKELGLQAADEELADLLLHKDELNEEQRRGILQSIGFKEFRPFLRLSKEMRESENGARVFRDCVQDMKLSTIRYAKRQRRWVLNRFIRRPEEGSCKIFKLDVTSTIDQVIKKEPFQATWERDILVPCFQVINKNFDCNLPVPDSASSVPEPVTILSDHAAIIDKALPTDMDIQEPPFICTVCNNRHFYDKNSFISHITSKKHKKRHRSTIS